MKINSLLSAFFLAWALCVGGVVFAACPSSDLTGDCFVDFEDFEVLAGQWLTVYDINDLDTLAAEWLTTDPCVPPYLSYIPDGAFQMGDAFSEGFTDELPVHSVTVGAFFKGTTILSMVISESCALAAGGAAAAGPVPLTALVLVWGFAIVADSAQFSTSVSELAEPEYMGTMLTAQTAIGFLLTLVTIRLVPVVVEAAGWGWAFAMLALGPAAGSWAMWRLRGAPEAAKLAGGRR